MLSQTQFPSTKRRRFHRMRHLRRHIRRALQAESLENRRLLAADIPNANLVTELSGNGTAEISGTKWLDQNGNGVQDNGEGPLEGTTIYLDLNDNGVLDNNSIEPDDFPVGASLIDAVSGVTLSAINSAGNPRPGVPISALADTDASTGTSVIGNTTSTWFSGSSLLQIEFDEPVERISIDYISKFGLGSMGQLQVFDSSGTLLDTYTTAELDTGQVETMTLTRPSADIARAVASPQTTFGLLDNLRFGIPEPKTTTDANGQYTFTGLDAGDYVVSEVVPETFVQTFPVVSENRLFAVPAGAVNDIVELDPATGAEVNRFAAPADTSGGPDGLAFDGTHLWFINGFGDDTLYQLDPDTGAVIDSDLITAGSGSYAGLASLNGSIYILDFQLNDIFEFDPVSDTVTNQLNLTGIRGGLAGIKGPDRLVTKQGGSILEIDPSDGTITNRFNGGNGFGFGVIDGQIYTNASGSSQVINVFDRSGVLQDILTLPFRSSALGADDAP
ncbi:MAG: hypothetical protein MI861_08620, partial [Pirellulales bacterium]|nr:hypothetical protein [Pirellulales bacterium]